MKETAEGRAGKKPVMRKFSPEFSEAGIAAFALLEIEKKENFVATHISIAPSILQFGNEVQEMTSTVVIFGSFARGSETKGSDLDILAIGESRAKKRIDNIQERCFVTLKNRVSIRFMETSEFARLLKNHDPFALQIVKDHVVIAKAFGWVEIQARLNTFMND